MTNVGVRALALGSCLLFIAPAMWAQKDRIHEPIDSTKRVVFSTNISSNARAEFDQGPVDTDMKIGYIQMTLKPSDAQQAALEQLLKDQQDPASPNFHRWLMPEQFADQFGTSANDLATIETWLKSQGLSVVATSRARNWIAFGGTASQIKGALNTEIRNYMVDGEVHFANAAAPSVPAALGSVVRGFIGLNDFRVKPNLHVIQKLGSVLPKYTGTNGAHALAPADMATIYDVNPLFNQQITGSGQKIVIVGASRIIPGDITSFRSIFGLPTNALTIMLVPGSTDPGQNGALDEADADIEWSGALAPNAAQYYIYSSNLLFPVNYALSENLAPVISMSFAVCEARAATYGIGATDMQPLAQQANAQGTTIMVSSGDAGAAGCDPHGTSSVTAASYGLGVNLFASPPEVTSVGGTMFNDANGNFWATGNNASDGSALGYIPETSWNEDGSGGLGSTGGGFSIVYGNPEWQSGGVFANISARAQPDISFTAANHDGYFIFTEGGFETVGGTSLSTPSFAGMVALLNQYTKTNGQGNINPNIYRLAQGTSGIFHDITTGNNIVPCFGGTPNCGVNGGSFGYNAGPGYDLVTGWGSVDVTNLITNWAGSQLQTGITVTANPQNFALNGSTTLTATVKAIGSAGNPTGTVTFLLGTTSLGASPLSPAGSGTSTATLTIFASELPVGNDAIVVSYGGDRTFTGSSTAITLGVSVPTGGASAVIPSVSPNPVYQQTVNSVATWYYTVRLTEVAGVSTTLTGLTIAGNNYSTDIVSFFGSSSIAANGTLSASLQTTNLTVPATLLFIFSGVDGNGRTWSQQLNVQFLGPQISALLTLTGLPNEVTENSLATEPKFPWCQDLGLEENNGHAVYLTKFLADGQDLSDQIADYFGGTYLPPFASLLGGICWNIGGSLPQTLTYEVDGIDDQGNSVFTTLNSQFVGLVSNPGTLQATPSTVTMAVNSGSATSHVNISVQPGQAWTVSTFPNNRTASWLVVFPLSGTGSQTVNISASAAGLAPGVYQATLVFQSTLALPEAYFVEINFVVGTPNVTQFLNGATITDTGISPGLIFAVRGTGLGPQFGENYFITQSDLVTNNIAGMQVYVDGFLSPLLYVSQTQINAIAPYEIASKIGQRVSIQVVNNGVVGNTSRKP